MFFQILLIKLHQNIHPLLAMLLYTYIKIIIFYKVVIHRKRKNDIPKTRLLGNTLK